jgi:hypothetical protein
VNSEWRVARISLRLGNLHLQGGVWNGERVLPEGYAKFVSTLVRCSAGDMPDTVSTLGQGEWRLDE